MADFKGRDLHIVSFDIPLPANYGGAIDVYYKLQALHELGIRIHLHCFQYGRNRTPELSLYCDKVSYYPRIRWPWLQFSKAPFIVASRRSKRLLKMLSEDDFPILFEGLHTTAQLNHKDLGVKVKIVRTHNIEHHYYEGLADSENRKLKRFYFHREARKLKDWERILTKASGLAAISQNDSMHLQSINTNVQTISAFHPDQKLSSSPGQGKYALYHGSLGVSENDKAAQWLVSNVFNSLEIPLIIAGNKPSQELRKLVSEREGIELREDLDSNEIYELVTNAQLNVLPTFQATGIKLKLLAALFRGRFCVVNEPMVVDTGLEDLCIVCQDADDMKMKIEKVWDVPFSKDDIQRRQEVLENGVFSNTRNAKLLAEMLYS